MLREMILASIELLGADSVGALDSRYDHLLRDAVTLSSTIMFVSCCVARGEQDSVLCR